MLHSVTVKSWYTGQVLVKTTGNRGAVPMYYCLQWGKALEVWNNLKSIRDIMEYNQKPEDVAGDRWAVQLSSASLLLPSYYKFLQAWLKKKTKKKPNKQLELHIKILIINPIFFFFFFFFLVWTEHIQCHQVLCLKSGNIKW